ncbi:MAG: flagellar hook-length control protein FliK [Rhodospirillales bacterium]
MGDTLPLVSKNSGDVPIQGKQGKTSTLDLGALSATFADLLQRVGQSLDTTRLNLVAEYPVRSNTPEKPEPAPAPKDSAPPADDESRNRPDAAESRHNTPREDRRDDAGRDRGDAHPRDGSGKPSARAADTDAPARPGEHPQKQNQAADTASDTAAPATDATSAESTGGSDSDAAQSQPAAGNGAEAADAAQNRTVSAGTDGTASVVTPGLQTAEAILNRLIAAAETNPTTGQSQDTGKGSGESTAMTANALQGLAKAIAALGNHGAQQQSGQNGNQNLPQELQALAKAIVEARAEGKPVTGATPTLNAQTTAQQQAQALSQAIGDGNRAQVTVKVTNEAATLVSQPTATLSPNAATAATATTGDGQPLPLHAQQAVQNPAAIAQNPGTQHAAAQNAGQAQAQQASSQSGPTQNINTLASDAKAAGLVPANTAGQGATSGGGEGSTSTGSHAGTQESQQAQHNTQSQAAGGTKFNVPRQAVMDQITVNISRAVAAGLDKINIQLKPESLGRIEVQLEMAKDGKVSAVIHANNKDTLDLLQRDGKELVKALQDAGLQLDESDIEFNLRGQNTQAGGEDGPENGGSSGNAGNTDENGDTNDSAANDDFEDVDIIEEGRVNVRV